MRESFFHMRDDGMEEKGGADNMDEGGVKRIGVHRESEEKENYDMFSLTGTLEIQEESCIAERFTRFLHDRGSELYRFRGTVRYFEDFKRVLSTGNENRVEKKGFMKDKIRVRLGQATMFRIV